jgi:hypothetical protein
MKAGASHPKIYFIITDGHLPQRLTIQSKSAKIQRKEFLIVPAADFFVYKNVKANVGHRAT